MQTTTRTGTIGRKALALGLAAGLSLGLAACGDDDDDASTSADQADQSGDASGSDPYGDAGGTEESTTTAGGGGGTTLDVTGLQYSDVSAPAGGTLEIVNSSGAPHTFTSEDDSFEEVEFGPDETAEVQVPDEPGEYPFHCEIHSSMEATLTVG